MNVKTVTLSILVGLLAFFASRYAVGSPATDHGRKLFLNYCASCHGPTAKGDGLLAEAMKKKIPNLRKISERRKGNFPSKEIETYIDGRKEVLEHGSRTMPVWGARLADDAPYERPHQKERIVESRLSAIVAFLRSIQDGKTASVPR